MNKLMYTSTCFMSFSNAKSSYSFLFLMNSCNDHIISNFTIISSSLILFSKNFNTISSTLIYSFCFFRVTSVRFASSSCFPFWDIIYFIYLTSVSYSINSCLFYNNFSPLLDLNSTISLPHFSSPLDEAFYISNINLSIY